jgi:ferritin-like metal-binding protein YciE
MDADPDAVVAEVRAKRRSIDNRLELLRARMERAEPRRVTVAPAAGALAPLVAVGAAAAWLWARRRRKLDSPADLLVESARQLFGGEEHVTRALSRVQSEVSAPSLQAALLLQGRQSEDRLSRLKRVFLAIGGRPSARAGAGIRGIVAEVESLIRRRAKAEVRDLALVTVVRQMLHHQIAAYGAMAAHADTFGYVRAAALLQQGLDDLRLSDGQLALLAERLVYPPAARDGLSQTVEPVMWPVEEPPPSGAGTR